MVKTMIKKPNYLMFGRAMSGLNVDEPKLSSMLKGTVSCSSPRTFGFQYGAVRD